MDQYPSQPSLLPTRPPPPHLAEQLPSSPKREQSAQQQPQRPPLKRKNVDEVVEEPLSPTTQHASTPSSPTPYSSSPPSQPVSSHDQGSGLPSKGASLPPSPLSVRTRRRSNQLVISGGARPSAPAAADDGQRSPKRPRHNPPAPPRGPLPPKLNQNPAASSGSKLTIPPFSAGPAASFFPVYSKGQSAHVCHAPSPPKPSRIRRRAYSLPLTTAARLPAPSRHHHAKWALRPLILPPPSSCLPAPGPVASLSHLQLLTYHQLHLGSSQVAFAPPSLNPPITRATLRELDLAEILRNPQLRHDIVFDPNLMFRPNFDGERYVSLCPRLC
jgi:hypothetical protein